MLDYFPFFTTGYEGLNLEDFVKKLVLNKVNVLIDVREIPWSRKNGFSKNKLIDRFKSEPITYLSFPELGSPQPTRNQLRTDEDYKKFFAIYSSYVDEFKESLVDILTLLKKRSVCLMCYEKDVSLCHRKIIVDKIQKMNGKLKIKHL